MSRASEAGGGRGDRVEGESRRRPAPVLVLGCGNEAAGADGFGLLAARRLRAQLRRRQSPRVEVREAGIRTDLLDLAPDRWALLVLDAAVAPGVPPGLVFDVDWHGPEARHLRLGGSLSTHGFGVAEQLALAEALGLLPRRTRLLGVTVEPPSPASLCGGAAAGGAGALASCLGLPVRAVVRRAEQHIERWLAAWRLAGGAP